jgi:hypothetical protein
MPTCSAGTTMLTGAPVRRMQEDLMGVMSRGKQAASRCGVYVNRIQVRYKGRPWQRQQVCLQ